MGEEDEQAVDEAALDERQEVVVQGSPPLDFVQTRSRSMYRNVHGGCVNHRYTPMAILSYLHLQGPCRPGARANHALASACRLLFGVEGKPLADQIEADIIHTPSRQVLRAARLRLDIMSVIYQQKHFLRFDTISFYLADSSPQLGRNFFAIIEDSFTIPSRTCLNLMQRVKLEMQHVWDERLWPLATLGLGNQELLTR